MRGDGVLRRALVSAGPEARREVLALLSREIGVDLLASLSGRSRSTMSRYLRGRLEPPPEVVEAALLGIGDEELEARAYGVILRSIVALQIDVLEELLPLVGEKGWEALEGLAPHLCGLLLRHAGQDACLDEVRGPVQDGEGYA